MLTSAAHGVVQRHGGKLSTVADAGDAFQQCASAETSILAVDLRSLSTSPESLVADLQSQCATPPLVFGFGPHVHEQVLASARAAGFDEVATRGEFERRLDEIISRLDS